MKYYIIAGEASGDLHGANLMRALLQSDPNAQIRFWGGDAMSAVGGEPVRHIRKLAIMGFVEVVAHLRTVLGNISFCKRDIMEWHPDAIIGIDYPGFNLKIEKWAHEQGFKTIHYISPQLWAWKKGRIKGMRQYLDRLCYILPFEQEFYAANNMPQAVYVGHPLLDAITNQSNQAILPDRKRAALSNIIALLPGSRKQELKRNLPLMAQLATLHPEYQFVVAGMSLIGHELYESLIPKQSSNLTVAYDQTYPLLAKAYAAVVCSGTATLETGLFHVPQVVGYRANPISIALAKAIIGNRINHIALVDLIDNSNVVTELLQSDFSIQRLDEEFRLITTDNANRERMLEGYLRVEQALGGPGASKRTADSIIQLLNPNT